MATVLAISSSVARGAVGLAAIVPVLQGLGHEVIALPTVLLSNHPGHARHARHDVPAAALLEMLAALDEPGWLSGVDAVLTGYLPGSEHVHVAAEAVHRVKRRRPDARFLCDPVIGDDPGGLYIGAAAAAAVRSLLLPLADLMTPNRFELAWLSERAVTTAAEAAAAARALPPEATVVTSLGGDGPEIANVLIGCEGAWSCAVPRQENVPHGTGDLLSALLLGHWLAGRTLNEALGLATAGVKAVVDRSLGAGELHLVESASCWSRVAPLPVLQIGREVKHT